MTIERLKAWGTKILDNNDVELGKKYAGEIKTAYALEGGEVLPL